MYGIWKIIGNSYRGRIKELKLIWNLLYPSQLIETTVNQFITNVASDNVQSDADRNNDTTPTVMFSIPFISHSAADSTRRQLQDLSLKIGVSLQPMFTSKKIGEIIKTREPKPKIVNEQCVVYHFKCGVCEMDYVGFTNDTFFNASRNTPTQDLQLASTWSYNTASNDQPLQKISPS